MYYNVLFVNDLIAILPSFTASWLSIEADDITHENTFSVAVSGFTVSRLATSDIVLKHCARESIRNDLMSPGYRGWSYWKRSDEVHSVVGPGPVPYTLLARLSIGL